MAGYVYIGDPIVKTGIVDENAGIGAGKFVEMDAATGKVVLADAETAVQNLYFTVNVERNQYVGDDATAVKAKGDLIDCAAVVPTNEVLMTVASTSGFARGDELILAANGLVQKVPTTNGTYTVIGVCEGKTTHNGAPALVVRLVAPYEKTVS